MYRAMCKSKIHRAYVTAVNLEYDGSLTIDSELMEYANLLPFEKIQVLNLNNGSRAETYVIKGKAHSGVIAVNGALARLAQKGDCIIIISYAYVEENETGDFIPKIVRVDEKNRIIK